MEIHELKEKYAVQAGGVLLIISFFLPFYDVPLLSVFSEVSGYNMFLILKKIDFLKPTNWGFQFWAYFIAPFLFLASGIAALLKSQTLTGWVWVYALFIFGFSWYHGEWNSFFKIASAGFYIGMLGAFFVISSD